MSEKSFHVVDPEDYPKLYVKQKYPYQKILTLLLEGHEIFIEINRKNAYYFRKELEKRCNLPIESFPAEYKGMKGYVFRISLVKQILMGEGLEENKEGESH